MKISYFLTSSLLVISNGLILAQSTDEERSKATEVWEPQPPVITSSAPDFTPAPSDAIILFDGKDLNEWVSTNNPSTPAQWTVANGAFTVKKGTGNIQT